MTQISFHTDNKMSEETVSRLNRFLTKCLKNESRATIAQKTNYLVKTLGIYGVKHFATTFYHAPNLWDETGFKVGNTIAIQTQFAKMGYASKIRGGSVSSSRMGSSNQLDDMLFTSTELEVDSGEVSQHLTG
jgi:hypothetical protein